MTDQFCAIPIRAIGDSRLSAADFRVLGAIAWHDRMGRNGSGCYASHRTLAAEAKIEYTALSRQIDRLAGYGYISETRNPMNRRLRIYRVIYNENSSMVGTPANNPPDEATSPPGSADLRQTVCTAARSTAPIVGNPSDQVPEKKEGSELEYIPRSGRDSAKQGKNLTEARAFKGSAPPTQRLQWGDMIARARRLSGYSEQQVTAILMHVRPEDPEYHELLDSATSNDRLGEIMRDLASR